MIVMKFGGSSLASAIAIRRAAFLVRSEGPRNPVVVVSACGTTTDQLDAILEDASQGRAYLAWTKQRDLASQYYSLASELLAGVEVVQIEQYLRDVFRDLHLLTIDLAENGRELTPEIRDRGLSIGEQLSSRIVAAAFNRAGVPAVHLDARELIVTDDHFNEAAPVLWETYAKIRAALPEPTARSVGGPIPVLAGYIGATPDGRTSTLGRGGSDFTASLVGAAVHAEEIQIWTDVDGVMTCDPRVRRNVHRLTTLSYEEAAELARCGAKVLHPHTMEPARQLDIPVVVRNSLHPSTRETRILASTDHAATPVKSIAFATNITLLELRSLASSDAAHWSSALAKACEERHVSAKLIAFSDDAFYLALDGNEDARALNFAPGGAFQVHLRPKQTILSLVSEAISQASHTAVLKRATDALLGVPALFLPKAPHSLALRIAVPDREAMRSIDLLHEEFFHNPDRRVFAQYAPPAEAAGVSAGRERESVTKPVPVLRFTTRLA